MEFPSREPVQVRDAMDLNMLVAYLRSTTRTRPVVVLSIAWNHQAPSVSVSETVAGVAGRADIAIIPPEMTLLLSQIVAREASVFQGACRVYPAGTQWEENPRSVPLRMARGRREIENLLPAIMEDLDRVLAATVSPRTPSTPVTAAPPTTPTRPPTSSTPTPTVTPSNPTSPTTSTPSPRSPAPSPRSSTSNPPPPPQVATKADAATLAGHLLNPKRGLPTVVVSRAAGLDRAYVDVDALRKDLVGLAEVVEITTLAASWAFAAAMPPRCEVYGGAGRAYPVGDAWTRDYLISALRMPYGTTPRDCEQLTGLLLSDAMRLASRGSYATAVAPDKRRTVTGTVLGVTAGQGIVRLTNGGHAVLWPELTSPGVPAERLFVAGMAVTGELDPDSHRIDVRAMCQDADHTIIPYQADDTILVKVASVAGDSCVVTLFPGIDVTIEAQDATDETDVDLRYILMAGETTPARIISREDHEWLLSLTEADEAGQARPAPAILTGGPPWLAPADPETPAPHPTATTTSTSSSPQDPPHATLPNPTHASPHTPTAATSGSSQDPADALTSEALATDYEYVHSLRMEKKQLSERLNESAAQVADLKNQLAILRTQRREGTRQRSRADREARAQRRAEADQDLFLDEAEQLNFEISLAWARMIPAADKENYPLKPWGYSDHFFSTLHDIQGVSRDKIVEVLVHVLTGRDSELSSRQRHHLRTGPGGDDPYRIRKNGEYCYRVSLQHKTPQARRLHYWVCADGSIELASIRRHDDFET